MIEITIGNKNNYIKVTEKEALELATVLRNSGTEAALAIAEMLISEVRG